MRFKEHLKAPSPINDHFNTTGHQANIDYFRILGREAQNLAETIDKAFFIRVNEPSLNRKKRENITCYTYVIRFCLTPKNSN